MNMVLKYIVKATSIDHKPTYVLIEQIVGYLYIPKIPKRII